MLHAEVAKLTSLKYVRQGDHDPVLGVYLQVDVFDFVSVADPAGRVWVMVMMMIFSLH